MMNQSIILHQVMRQTQTIVPFTQEGVILHFLQPTAGEDIHTMIHMDLTRQLKMSNMILENREPGIGIQWSNQDPEQDS